MGIFFALETKAAWNQKGMGSAGKAKSRAATVERHPNSARALVMALLEACRFIDTTANRRQVADLIAGASYTDTPTDVIAPRFLGDYEDDLGCKWKDAHAIRFRDDGARRVNVCCNSLYNLRLVSFS